MRGGPSLSGIYLLQTVISVFWRGDFNGWWDAVASNPIFGKRLISIGQIKSKLCLPPNISTTTAPNQLEDAAGRKKALI